MVSYRGYGRSGGNPSENGIRKDAVAALQYACDRTDVLDVSRIYLFGRSIGGACAIALASTPLARRFVRGLIVENTFLSIDDMIDVVLPILSFAKIFNRNKWLSTHTIRDINTPIMFIRFDIAATVFLFLHPICSFHSRLTSSLLGFFLLSAARGMSSCHQTT